MFEEKLKLNCSLDTYERLEISGDNAYQVVESIPDLHPIELHQTLITNVTTNTVTKLSKWVVDYKGSLTPELVQSLATKWQCKIVWRQKEYI